MNKLYQNLNKLYRHLNKLYWHHSMSVITPHVYNKDPYQLLGWVATGQEISFQHHRFCKTRWSSSFREKQFWSSGNFRLDHS